MTIISWNVNGLRAIAKKGFLEWFKAEFPNILCIQETKASPEQLHYSLIQPLSYFSYYNSAVKKGYSGVATYSRKRPKGHINGLGIPELDQEGRVVMTEFGSFILFNIYFPNGKKNEERLKYKLDFYDACLDVFNKLRDEGKRLVICGDFNTAHKEIDLARPKENEKVSGFLPIERALLDKFVSNGYVDTFRHFCQEPGHYTWWDQVTRARERNVGWRIDYFFVSENLVPKLKRAWILPEVMGSDHCPVGLEFDL